jgi:hypothetical protein
MRARTWPALAFAALSIGACASAGTSRSEDPVRRAVFLDVYWGGARACEGRHATLHLERVEQEGSVTLSAAADSRSELRAFVTCYHSEIRSRVERRQGAGLPLPADLDMTPSVELD